MPSTRRSTTRSRTWPETKATLYITDNVRPRPLPITGPVVDIGSKGMFMKTMDFVPLPANALITIAFDPDPGIPDARLTVKGEVVRRCADGVGIRFTGVDMKQLQKCIISRMNRVDAADPDARYHLEDAGSESNATENVYRLRDRKKVR